MEKKIIFEKKDGAIVIKIDIELLAFVAENIPDNPFKVYDADDLADAVIHELENNDDPDTGITSFQYLIEKCIVSVVEDANPCIDFIEN